jgi:hypothetical protein
MFSHRSKIRELFVSRRSRTHAAPRARRTLRFESLETRQMFDGTSIVPMENMSLNVAPDHTGGVSGDSMPVENVSLNFASVQPGLPAVPANKKDVLVDLFHANPDQPITVGVLDARNLLPYIEQDNVRSLGVFPWLAHLDRQVVSSTEQLQVCGFSGNEGISQLFSHQTFGATIPGLWTDIYLPVVTTPDGRSFKPLFAFYVEDLDNRLNFNVPGNAVRGATSTQPGAAAEALPHYWVFGTELPSVVLNEAFVEHQASPSGDAQPRVWAMLWSPLEVNPGSVPPGCGTINIGADELHAASLRNAYLNTQFVRFWNISGDADDRPTEEVAFYYTRIPFQYLGGGVDGDNSHIFSGGTRVAAGDVNGDGRADVLAVWDPWDINPGSLPPGVPSRGAAPIEHGNPATSDNGSTAALDAFFALCCDGEHITDAVVLSNLGVIRYFNDDPHTSFSSLAEQSVPNPDANGPEPHRPPLSPEGPEFQPSGPTGARPNPNGPEPYRLWEVGPDGELYPLGQGPAGSTPLNPPPVELGGRTLPPSPPNTPSGPTGPRSGPFGPNGPNGPEPYRRWEVGPDGEHYPLGAGPEGSTPVPTGGMEFHSPAGNPGSGLQAPPAGDGWGWIELREGATENGYNKGTTDAGSFHVVKLVNVKHNGVSLNGDYWVTVYDNDGKELKKTKITFENGNATLNTDVSVNRDLNISKVGVSTPPK